MYNITYNFTYFQCFFSIPRPAPRILSSAKVRFSLDKMHIKKYYKPMSNSNDFISEFLDSETITALDDFIKSPENFSKPTDTIAKAFGASDGFSSKTEDDVKKLLASFKNNLTLLIQKTWVDKSDIALKDQLIFKLNKLLKEENCAWKDEFSLFLEIINQAVYLMFGQKTDDPEFSLYTIRIDPEFGIFWWYISSLPAKNDWTEEKCRLSMMLGMYFLANY